MKLLQRTNRMYLLLSAGVFLAAGVVLYFVLSNLIQHEQDEKLMITKQRISTQLSNNVAFTDMPPIIEVRTVESVPPVQLQFSDTVVFDAAEGEEEPFRQLRVYETINGKNYSITVRSSRLQSHDFSEIVLRSIGVMLFVLLIILVFMNRLLSKNIWKPFYSHLETIKNFSLTGKEPLQLQRAGITEFDEMKTELEKLTQKITADYNNLKMFTENASHEIQTPLAVILSKIESMMQENNLQETQASSLQVIYNAAQRLSKLNEGLLLLTKIENKQFAPAEEIELNKVVRQQVDFFSELTGLKNIDVTVADKNIFTHRINKQLADILIKNLLENALKHTEHTGKIEIEISHDTIQFRNSGNRGLQAPENIFTRFTKGENAANSLGLGLAIVKDICDNNNLRISYTFENGNHCFAFKK